MADTIKGISFEGSSTVLLARVQDVDGNILQQADISTIQYESWKHKRRDPSPSKIAGPTSLTVADVVFDVLQTDTIWTSEVDSTGYNFRASLPSSIYGATAKGEFPETITYIIEVKFTLGSGELAIVPFESSMRPTLFGK